MDIEMIMLEAAMQKLATRVAERYDGPRDRDGALAAATEIWQMKVRDSIAELVKEAELDVVVDDKLLDMCHEIFVGALAGAVIELGPRGPHEAVTVEWGAFGPARAPAKAVPPSAIKIEDYLLVWDPARAALVYAMSPDYHQFGHAWSYDGQAWSQTCGKAARLSSAQQGWSGAYDVTRGAVVGWNVDGEAPIAVVIRDGEVEVLGAASTLERLPVRENLTLTATSGEPPTLESDKWCDACALFGFDRERKVWVVVSEHGVWEFDADNRWHRTSAVIPEELNEAASGAKARGAVWDAPRNRLVLWFAGRKAYFAAWDGATLEALTTDGIPEEAFTRYGPSAIVIEDPTRGVAIYAGPDDGAFAFDGKAWSKFAFGDGAPARSRDVTAVLAPKGDAMFGPGDYGGEGDQNVFYVRHGGAWERQGRLQRKSALAALRGSGGWPLLAAAGGAVYATAWSRSLETARWDEATDWQVVVDATAGQAAFKAGTEGRLRAAVFEGRDGALCALSHRGALFRLDAGEWKPLAGDSEVFGERSDFCACYDRALDRVVVWGGRIDDRKTNDTLILDADGAWRLASPSPRPVDLHYHSHQHGFSVDYQVCFDTTLGEVVRLGFESVAVLDGDRWLSTSPKYLLDFLTPEARRLAHDPVTGETLAVCFRTGVIMRLDLGGCDMVGRVTPLEREGKARVPFRDLVFEPRSRRLLTYAEEDQDDRFCLELGAVFDRAASLGARKTELPEPVDPVRLYRAEDSGIRVFYADAKNATEMTIRVGLLGEGLSEGLSEIRGTSMVAELASLAQARRDEGYVPAAELDHARLHAAVGRPAWKLALADEPAGDGEHPTCRMGGLPSGIDPEKWPRDDDDEPMGFLFQLATPSEVHEGGVAVFCKVNGQATEDPYNNAAILLTPEQLAAAPCPAPEGVPVMSVTELIVGERALVVGSGVSDKLGADDPGLAEIIDKLVGGGVDGTNYVGGYPHWVQHAATNAPLIAQLDFDGISLDDAGWSDAGLFGVLYVFDDGDGDATVMWQYT